MPPARKLRIGCEVGNRSGLVNGRGPPAKRTPSPFEAATPYFGVLGLVVEVLLLELLFEVPLGFMLPLLLPVPGAFDVSVVDPVVGAAGRA
jgi:hypothetical protein